MASLVELKRLFSEWRIRLQRVQDVLQPPMWTEGDWNQFARALYMLVQKYGSTWKQEGVDYWDIRWDLREGGNLICQVEEEPGRRSLVVAQVGGFAGQVEHYTWFYAELTDDGHFAGEPYWVDGMWKDALAMILLPHRMAAGFYLSDSSTAYYNNLLADSRTEEAPSHRHPQPQEAAPVMPA